MPVFALLEGGAAEPGELIVGGCIQVGKRQRAIPDSGGDPLQRHAGSFKALQPPRPERVTRRERISRTRRQDAQLDQPVDIAGVDPSPLGDLLPRVSAHASARIASCRPAGVACSHRPYPTFADGRRKDRTIAHIGLDDTPDLVVSVPSRPAGIPTLLERIP